MSDPHTGIGSPPSQRLTLHEAEGKEYSIPQQMLYQQPAIYVEEANVVVMLASQQGSVKHPKRHLVTDEFVQAILQSHPDRAALEFMITVPSGSKLIGIAEVSGLYVCIGAQILKLPVFEDALLKKPLFNMVLANAGNGSNVFSQEIADLETTGQVVLNETDIWGTIGICVGQSRITQYREARRRYLGELATPAQRKAELQAELAAVELDNKAATAKLEHELGKLTRELSITREDRDRLAGAVTRISDVREFDTKDRTGQVSLQKMHYETEKARNEIGASLVKFFAAALVGGAAVYAAIKKA